MSKEHKRYRAVLYADYSNHFGEGYVGDERTHFGGCEQRYSMEGIPQDARIGDLGCGRGGWLHWLKSKGYRNLVGIERATSELAAASTEGIEFVNADLLEGFGREEEYDLLHAKDVFEHMDKDEAVDFLSNCHNCLKPGGRVWILTYNAQSPLAGITRYGDFTHELGVTPSSISQVLRAVGFENVTVRTYFPHSGGWKGRLREVIGRLMLLPVGLWAATRYGRRRGPLRAGFAPSLFAVGSKPATGEGK